MDLFHDVTGTSRVVWAARLHILGSKGGSMKLTELLLAELESEGEKSRRALEQVPEGKHDWKPHDKSMIFGYLAEMVATIPTWFAMIAKQDELDIAPKGGPTQKPTPKNTSAESLAAPDKAASGARAALLVP